jgi:hypothetical protein
LKITCLKAQIFTKKITSIFLSLNYEFYFQRLRTAKEPYTPMKSLPKGKKIKPASSHVPTLLALQRKDLEAWNVKVTMNAPLSTPPAFHSNPSNATSLVLSSNSKS